MLQKRHFLFVSRVWGILPERVVHGVLDSSYHVLYLQNVSNIVADTNYVVSTVMVIRDLAKAKAKTSAFWSPLGRLYLYLFNHFPTFKANLPELGGTSHGDDLSYEFDPMPELGNRQGFTDIENDIGFIFRAMLASFAKTG